MSQSHHPFKLSDQLQVSIGSNLEIKLSGRATTNIGTQGAHTSAYHLIEMLVLSIQHYSGLDEAIKRLFSFFSDIQGNIEIELALTEETNITESNNITFDDIQNYQNQLYQRNQELDSIIFLARTKIDNLMKEVELNSKYSNDIKKLINLGKNAHEAGEIDAVYIVYVEKWIKISAIIVQNFS